MVKKIVITGGHLTPAIAMIEKLKQQGWEIIFVGRKYALEGEKIVSVEYQTITKLGINFLPIVTGRLQRSLTRYTVFSLTKVPIGFFQSLYWLIKYKPKIILSFGSYVALPVALAGWILNIPIITHEQSVVPGMATKIISKLAKTICVSWVETMSYFPKDKTVLTGNPLRREIFRKIQISDSQYPISDDNLPLIYITGGSLGAQTINDVVIQILPKLLEKFRIIHQCGSKDYGKLLTNSNLLPATHKNRYILTKYVEFLDIGWVLNNADLVISRSGANTVSELAALGKPALLIPLPWSGQQEQMKNAKILEQAGTAKILEQKNLDSESLSQCINSMIQDLQKYQDNSHQAKALISLNASEKISDIINKTSIL
ncbi:MAG: UDP-N-acetylglucosamine--N-acetylmuramyl-(pentapeptide) pyrophosphoryl-undecaprenol N-acetylglucosamine transferase [Candidatus Gottesmanbacteria bacterium]